ncbi:MAG: acyl-CoA desaturase, partial [Jatrophihabitans sp.]|uniref:acyl-CoA desaturase n=1 Tax=Jatrophihabitans sp. TaxID=1932789 RepID=UPI00390EA866
VESPRVASRMPKPELGEDKAWWEQAALYVIVLIPFVAFVAVVPVVWGRGIPWTDVLLTAGWYFGTLLGVTVGFHRYFTHSAFKAKRGLRIALAIAGSFALEGPPIMWVADHRRHHAFSDKEGDPHSPWRFGNSLPALFKGIWFAHVGWLFTMEQTNQEKYAPDLLKDRDIVVVDSLFPVWIALTLTLPGVMGGLITMSWSGAVSAFFWAGLVRVFLLHHVTWSINSICHVVGDRPFAARDKSANFWPLAILSGGESWHNMHHADPTAARHGVLRAQIDISARVIWLFEKLGWAWDVRWPSRERIQKLRKSAVA